MTLLEDSVTQAKDGTWGFTCPGVQGDPCGEGTTFTSTQWPTKKAAIARGRQHFDEHKGNASGEPAPMQPLEEFRQDQGLVVNDDGSVSVKDL